MSTKENTCKHIVELFINEKKKFFEYNAQENLIQFQNNDSEIHESLFLEINNITNKLHELKCEYTIDNNCNIRLHCSLNENSCMQ